MSGEIMLGVVALAVMLYSVWMIRSQQRTIDRLTDKLMARNYGEYKSMDSIKEDDASPVRQDDDPKSWYDH